MIAGIFHTGSGMGNQLFRYVATRVLALDKGYEFGMKNPANFKGKDFMKLDTGHSNFPFGIETWQEKRVEEGGVDIRGYDPEINFVPDNMLIDGEFQDSKYFEHRMKEVDEWLKVEPLDMPNNVCVIGFRGREFVNVPDLFLPFEYWEKAIEMMREINSKMIFEVHTDDINKASEVFGWLGCKIIHDIEINWRSMKYAKYAIIANSSFYILPRLLNGGMTIAPRYWARYNTKVWALPQNFYKQFKHI